MKQTRVWAALGALALGTSMGVTATWAQVDNPFGAAPTADTPVIGARTVYFWSAIGGAENVITGKWGNGDATKAQNVDYEGKDSLQVTTHSFGEGARFDLKTGVPIDPYLDKGYLRIRVRFSGGGGFGGRGGMMGGMDGGAGGAQGGFGGRGGGRGGRGGFGGGIDGDEIALPTLGGSTQPRIQAQAQMDGPGEGGVLPGIPGGGFGGRGGLGGGQGGFGGGQGGFGGGQGGFGGGFGGRGGFGGGRGGRSQSTTITQIQATLQLDRGIMTTYIPIDLQNARPDSSGWYLFPVRISDMRSTPNAGGSVRRLILTSDADESFYLAQAALVVDNGQLTLNVRRTTDPAGAQIGEITVHPGPLTLVADVEAGATDPEVTWNFDADDAGLPRTDIPDTMRGGMDGGTMGGDFRTGGAPQIGGTRGNIGGGATRGAAGRDPRIGGAGVDGGTTQQYGPRVDARGLTATVTYPNEEQDYRVEVTVRDRSGRKKPITSSILVKVRA